MSDKVRTITRDTAIPLGLLVLLVSFVFWAATDRSQALGSLEATRQAVARHEDELKELRARMEYVAGAMQRVEVHLGTAPRMDAQRRKNPESPREE